MITSVEYVDADDNLVQIKYDDRADVWMETSEIKGQYGPELKDWLESNTITPFVDP